MLLGVAACGGASASSPSSASASSAPLAEGGRDANDDATPEASGDVRDVRRIHASRCGNCHVRVEPGQRTRAELESALARHHKRVKMNDAEWRAMIDYLAKPGT